MADLVTMDNFNFMGAYFDRNTIPAEYSELSHNEKNTKELWDMSELYIKN